MKSCPKCNSTFSDDTLSFCLSDGAALVAVEEQETEEFTTSDRGEMRINIPKETVAYEAPAAVTVSEPKKKGASAFILGILAALLLLIVVGIGGIALYYLAFDNGKKKTAEVLETTPTSDKEVEALKKKLEELQGQIENKDKATPAGQKETPDNAAPEPTDSIPAGTSVVNSPADGFLALRTLPNHKTGTRIAKIPHGATITLSGCLKRTKIGNRTGRWCRTSYKGQNGWVFDAWVRR